VKVDVNRRTFPAVSRYPKPCAINLSNKDELDRAFRSSTVAKVSIGQGRAFQVVSQSMTNVGFSQCPSIHFPLQDYLTKYTMQYICFYLLAASAICFDKVTGRKPFESPQQQRRARNVDEIADTVANVADGYNQSDFRFLNNET
jgi:hypothetical protein